MDKRRASLHKGIVVIAILLLSACRSSAQDSAARVLDYSFLKYSEVAEFFGKYDLKLSCVENPDLYFESYCWMRTPYKYAGDTKKGIDCSGFAAMLYDRIYGKKVSGGSKDIFTKCMVVPPDSLHEGDLLFFTIKDGISHIGVYLGNNKFVHATVQGGVMVNDLNEPYYKNTFYKVGRLIE